MQLLSGCVYLKRSFSHVLIGIEQVLTRMANKRACVIVLGDVGRSPRMQYHALSLAKEEYDVDVIGYSGSSPYSDILFSSRISFHYMKQPPAFSHSKRFCSFLLIVLT